MDVPLILVTNDDGVHAPGIRALAAALTAVGNVCVVAPDREVSACAQALTLTRPVEVREIEPKIYAADGTPADCVNMAVARLLERRPDVVVAGINRGANLGEDVFYSGTVGGAREGTFCGIPSLAISLAARGEADFAPAADIAARLVRLVLEQGLPERTLLNVNVPLGKPERAVVTVQGQRASAGGDSSGAEQERASGGNDRAERAMTDVEAIHRGLVSVTPLHTDTTHHAALSGLGAWNLVFGNGHRD